MAGRFSVESVFKAIDRVTAPVSRMQRGVARFTRSVRRGFRNAGRAVNRFGRTLKKVSVVGVAGILALSLSMGTLIKTGAVFEQTLVNAAAKFPEDVRRGTEAFKDLETIARKLGATTEFTASQAASGLNFLAMAGFNAKQSMAALPGLVDLATAAQVDLGIASDIATDSLGAFGLRAKDAVQNGKNLVRVSDALAFTTKSANTHMELLMETIKDGAPVAVTAGVSMETFLAATGELANAGIKGSKAGTTLKNMFLKLARPEAQAAKLLDRLGVKTKDANGDFRDLFDILEDTKIGLQGFGSAEKSAALDLIFGKRAIAGVNILMKVGSTRLREYRAELEGATGATGRMAAMMRDTLKGSALTMVSAFESLQITIFKLKQTAINGLIKEITRFIRVIDIAIQADEALATELIDGLFRAVKGVLGVFGVLVGTFLVLKTVMLASAAAVNIYKIALFGLKVALFAYKGVLVGVKLAMLAFNIAMGLSPLGVILILIGALIIAGTLLVKNWDKIVGAFRRGARIIKSVLLTLIKPFTDVFGGVRAILSVGRQLGLIGPSTEGAATSPGAEKSNGVVSPQARVAQSIEERRTTSTAEVTIKDQTGRAEVTKKSGGFNGIGMEIIESGGF